MKIDRKLNLVLTVTDDEDKVIAHIHSAPISRLVFETYFMTLTKAHAAMMENGADWFMRSGPRTALLLVERIAKADKVWEGPEGVAAGFMEEVRRLTNAYVPTERGWDFMPLSDLYRLGRLSEDDISEVENAITFFTVLSRAVSNKEANEMLAITFGLYGAQTTFLNATEWLSSLPTSTPEDATGETETALSIPV